MKFSANGTNFAVIDVKGDGNFLWNSLVESKWVNFTPDILRENVFRQIDCRLNNGGPARRDIERYIIMDLQSLFNHTWKDKDFPVNGPLI